MGQQGLEKSLIRGWLEKQREDQLVFLRIGRDGLPPYGLRHRQRHVASIVLRLASNQRDGPVHEAATERKIGNPALCPAVRDAPLTTRPDQTVPYPHHTLSHIWTEYRVRDVAAVQDGPDAVGQEGVKPRRVTHVP